MRIIRENLRSRVNLRRRSGVNSSKMSMKFLLAHTKEFCNKTSLHGLKYVTEDGCHWVQSVFWGTFIILGVIFCCILMILIWSRFSSNPTITAVETVNYPVWKIPFPSVTICDVNKVHKGKIQRIKNILTSNNISEEKAMRFFQSLVMLINFMDIEETFPDVFTILDRKNISLDSLMMEVSHKCSEFLVRCTWLGKLIDCSQLFRLIKTDEGFCCSFNYYHTNETYDSEQEPISDFKVEAIHTAGAGIQTGISVVININESNYLSTSRNIPSAIVLVHETTNYPEMRTLGTIIKRGELVHIPVEASVIDTTSDVKTLSYTVRNCTFQNEISLSIGEYGYENCIIECRMDTILSLCDCLPYFYNLKYYKHKNVRLCNFADMLCVSKNQQLLFTLSSEESNENSRSGLLCKCYPFCDIYWYNYPVDVGYMDDDITIPGGYANITGLHVYFSEFSCIKYKQSNLITWDGLFASFGGIFGLCLGGSILSIVEFFYHFTIRLYVSLKKINQDEVNDYDEFEKTEKRNLKQVKLIPDEEMLSMFTNQYSLFTINQNKKLPLLISQLHGNGFNQKQSSLHRRF